MTVITEGQKELAFPPKSTYWMAYNEASGVWHIGTTEPNQVTTTGQPVFFIAEDEVDLLEHSNEFDIDYAPLPEEGEWVESGIYSFEGKLVIARQPHNRTNFHPSETPALFAVWRPDQSGLDWIVGEEVKAGWRRMFDGKLYQVITPHMTQADFNPVLTLDVLWFEVPEGGTTYPQWLQPIPGVEGREPYTLDEIVFHNGSNWISRNASNVWEPGVVGSDIWEIYTE
jgi:hypothetical protein